MKFRPQLLTHICIYKKKAKQNNKKAVFSKRRVKWHLNRTLWLRMMKCTRTCETHNTCDAGAGERWHCESAQTQVTTMGSGSNHQGTSLEQRRGYPCTACQTVTLNTLFCFTTVLMNSNSEVNGLDSQQTATEHPQLAHVGKQNEDSTYLPASTLCNKKYKIKSKQHWSGWPLRSVHGFTEDSGPLFFVQI